MIRYSTVWCVCVCVCWLTVCVCVCVCVYDQILHCLVCVCVCVLAVLGSFSFQLIVLEMRINNSYK